jgi:hypothetical protein
MEMKTGLAPDRRLKAHAQRPVTETGPPSLTNGTSRPLELR